MEILNNEENREEQLRRYRLCLKEFSELDYHDAYIDQNKTGLSIA